MEEPEFEIVSDRPKTYPNFPLRGREVIIRPLIQSIKNPEDYVDSLFQFALDNLLHDVDSDSLVGFAIESSNCTVGKALYIPWRRKPEMTSQHILSSIERVLNSNESFLLGENVSINVTITDPIRGQSPATTKAKNLPLEQYLKNHIIPSDKIPDCLARSSVMAKRKADKNRKKTYYLKKNDNNWAFEAELLRLRAGVDLLANNGGSIEDVDKFQHYFDDEYQIVLYRRNEMARNYEKIYQGPKATKKLFFRYEIIILKP
jgi:hypothetical protein